METPSEHVTVTMSRAEWDALTTYATDVGSAIVDAPVEQVELAVNAIDKINAAVHEDETLAETHPVRILQRVNETYNVFKEQWQFGNDDPLRNDIHAVLDAHGLQRTARQ